MLNKARGIGMSVLVVNSSKSCDGFLSTGQTLFVVGQKIDLVSLKYYSDSALPIASITRGKNYVQGTPIAPKAGVINSLYLLLASYLASAGALRKVKTCIHTTNFPLI